ncbi:MAG: transcriptional regulator [Desulfobacteraceae bacterium]
MARGDQLSRQWRIIQSLMAARKGKSATDLAQALECHSRTVYRDLEALQMAGFPLYTEKSEGRTLWSILEGGRHNMPIPLDLTELMALYFSRKLLGILEGSAIHDSLESLFEKVKATLPDAYVEYLKKIENSIAVGVRARKTYQQFQKTLTAVQDAVQRQCHIEIDYFTMSRGKSTRRRVAPYKIWFYKETFYLIGHCAMRNDIRLFAIDRIEQIRLTEDLFELPGDFDAETYMASSFGVYQGEPVKVRIRFSAEVAGYVSEKMWHPTQTLTPASDGSIVFTAEVAGIDEIKRWIMGWGSAAQVLEPPALRTAIAKDAKAMLKFYEPNK